MNNTSPSNRFDQHPPTSACSSPAQRDPLTSWGLLVVGTLSAMAIASSLAFVATRELTKGQALLEDLRTHQQELARLEQLVETIPGGVVTVDVPTGTIVDCNEGFRNLTGHPSSQLVGRSILSIIPPENRAMHQRLLIDEVEATWARWGRESFVLPEGRFVTATGRKVTCRVTIRGTRVGGRREWLIFLDPRGLDIEGDELAWLAS